MEENQDAILARVSSKELDKLAEALSEFQGSLEQPKLEKLVKVKTNKGYSYEFKYADLSACCKAAAPHLKATGLSVTQIVTGSLLITLLMHKTGQWIKTTVPLPPLSSDYQGFGSALTYLKRYSYCAILGIVADADDDANLAEGNKAEVIDRKAHGDQQKSVEELMDQAISELKNVQTMDQFNDLWQQWWTKCPAICQNGSRFYKAMEEKSKILNS